MFLALAMLCPFIILLGGILVWDYLSATDFIRKYPHLVISGSGLVFGFLVGRMILAHMCDEPKGLKTGRCMGATEQVRFQPRIGHLLAAAAAERVVSIYDVETDRQTHGLQGHNASVRSICWYANGDYLESVSEDFVKVWSLNLGECIHELSSNGNKFHSFVFHPSYSTLLVVRGYQTLEVWNMAENKSMMIPAHEGQIAALAQSSVTGMVA